jgi:hypothetical protein
MPQIKRRDFLASGLVAIGATIAGPAVWRRALAAPAQTAVSPYGPLLAPDANGVRLPEGFTSRVIARSLAAVGLTTYLWHVFPDGGATYPVDDGGWIYVSNSEVPGGLGGVGAVRFAPDGDIVDAYPILQGSSSNCAGGPTPWGTWLSCEESDTGRVWECDPYGAKPAVVLPAMGVFTHESAAVDEVRRRVYLTEDEGDGRFYRFTPASYPDLSSGQLEVARVHDIKAVAKGGRSEVSWIEVPDPSAASGTTRTQVPTSTPFDGGEGTWFDSGIVYFTSKGDNRVWAFDTLDDTIEILYDDDLTPNPPLSGVDNVFVSRVSGDLFVAEDGGDLQVVMITPDRTVAPLLQVVGTAHEGSELAGPAMNPAQDRFYFSSQRGNGFGVTFEITGPFRRTPPTQVLASSTVRVNETPSGDTDRETEVLSAALPNTGPSGAPVVATGRRRRSSTTENDGMGVAAALGVAAVAGATGYVLKRLGSDDEA